jgi:inorganic pyrophosphatase
VLENDNFWGGVKDIEGLPAALIDRLRHYFETYKLVPERPADIHIGEPYGRGHAEKVIEAAMRDYETEFGSG